MNDFVKFRPDDVALAGYLRFSMSNKAFERIKNHPMGVLNMLSALSASRVLLFTKSKLEGCYEVYTAYGSYLCRATDDHNGLLITGFYENNLLKQNNALKNGICFRITCGIIIQIKLKDPYNLFFDICNGRKEQNNYFEKASSVQAVGTIAAAMAKAAESQEEGDIQEEKYQPEKKLLNLLQMAEHYAILSGELEEKKANKAGKLSYFKINALEFDRVDRIAYQFEVDTFDENVYKQGAKVEIEDNKAKRHAGEIIEIIKHKDKVLVSILFNDHFSINDLPQIGWISISFSTINKEVQLAAIEKIRDGKAAAKYMDTVLGRNSSMGFENKDLSKVTEELMKEDNPPNKSQMKAIYSGIGTKDVFLVMGPPGTGKTTVILEWIKYFVKEEHKRVLVSSQNNKAVDNVLERIADEKDIDIIRLGSETKLQSKIIPYVFENKIKNLSLNIGEKTRENTSKIRSMASEWERLLEGIKLLMVLNQEIAEMKNALDSRIKAELIPRYAWLCELLQREKELSQRLKVQESIIREEVQKIEDYESMGKSFKKAFLAIPATFRRNAIQKDTKLFDELMEKETGLCAEYNTQKLLYNSNSAAIENENMHVYYNKLLGRNATISEILKLVPKQDCKWMLFTDINLEEQSLKSVEGLHKIINSIRNELKKAKGVIDAVSEWKTDIESRQNYALNEIVLESVDLVGATCIGINSQRRFANLDFDVTIIDEAGQIQIHNALVPMSVSNKLIMLGDHKQIPPSADKELLDMCYENTVDTKLLNMSLFEKMYGDLPEYNKIMLDTQYRIPSEIADIISEWFYDEKYLSADFKKNMKGLLPALSSKPFVIIDTSRNPDRIENPVKKAGSDNPLEADIITRLVQYLAGSTDIDLKELGVISAYKSQVKLIKSKLLNSFGENQVEEMVATLDSYQGQERNIIVYSFTKSSTKSPDKKRIGFLNELRRLNVAMTRCKKMLVLVGDMKFLSECRYMEIDEDGQEVYDQSEKQFSDFIQKMLEYVKKGRGEIISCEEFFKRINSGGEQ